MAVTIPTDIVLQPDDTDVTSSSGRSFTITYKGPYSSLSTFKGNLGIGTEFDNKIVKSVSLRRSPGNLGLLEISLSKQTQEGDGDSLVIKAERAIWTCKSVRNDKSILAYCGPKSSNPNRAWIESWMAERDAAIAKDGDYRKDNGTIAKLSEQEHHSPTWALIGKINAGIDAVVRFYPVLTCTATYASIPKKFIENLGFIDTPAARAADEVKAPDNLTSIIAAYSWLKVQDDVSETADGKWQRVESWMGSDNAWDADLYGSERWAMPMEG